MQDKRTTGYKALLRIASLAVSIAYLAFVAVPIQASAVEQPPNDLEKQIQGLIRESGAEMVGVAYFDLATGKEILINADENFHAASTMKVPVMMEVFRQDRNGKLSLDDYIPIKNQFISIVDGTRFSISAEDDSEQTLYNRVGKTETVRELMRMMIAVSSNLATNLLIERVNAPSVMDFMREIGAKNIQVLRGVEDGRAYELGMNNTTTARDLMIILRHIARRQAVSSKASNEMIKILLDQKFNDGIPAGLPKGIKVAHKTGSITKINHDAAIVFPPNRKPYVLVVLTRGIEDEKRANKLIADISRTLYKS
jgi:beta-lactamase class A